MKYIIDTDPGVDDLLALTVALNRLDVLLMTIAGGNIELERAVQNGLNIVHFFGKETRVCKGSDKSFVGKKFVNENWLFGERGICNHELPKSPHKTVDGDVSEVMYQTIKSAGEKVTLLAMAPLTNIANLLQKYPDVKECIHEIIAMGGSVDGRGNVTEWAEFNFYSDPEAAKLVLESEINIVLFPLTFTRYATLTKAEIELLGNSGKKTGKLLHLIITAAYANFEKMFKTNNKKSLAMHDVFVSLYCLDKTLFETQRANVTINTDHTTKEIGQTFCNFVGAKKSHIQVVCDLEKEKVSELLFEVIKSCN